MRPPVLRSAHWFVRPTLQHLGRARSVVQGLLDDAGVGTECRERTVIVVDELLCNVIQHVPGYAVLSVDLGPDAVRVAVTDPASLDRFARWRTGPSSGLALVGRLCRTVSVQPAGAGKTVSAEIARDASLSDDDGDGRAEAVVGPA